MTEDEGGHGMFRFPSTTRSCWDLMKLLFNRCHYKNTYFRAHKQIPYSAKAVLLLDAYRRSYISILALTLETFEIKRD